MNSSLNSHAPDGIYTFTTYATLVNSFKLSKAEVSNALNKCVELLSGRRILDFNAVSPVSSHVTISKSPYNLERLQGDEINLSITLLLSPPHGCLVFIV